MMNDISQKLAKYALNKGFTYVHISKITGLEESKINKILKSGKKISANEFLSICEALNVTPETIKKM